VTRWDTSGIPLGYLLYNKINWDFLFARNQDGSYKWSDCVQRSNILGFRG
jgi:hypothetical protein